MSDAYKTKALQYEPEIAAFCDIVRDEGVRSYLEIGSKFGGSFWRVAQAMPKGSRLVSVDLPAGTKVWPESRRSLDACHGALRSLGYDTHCIWGDSTDADVIEQVRALGPFDLTLIDGDHRFPGCRTDWENYSPMCARVAFHDIAWKRPADWAGKYRIDVPELWAELKRDYRHREIVLDPTGEDNGIGVLWRD